MVGPARPPSAAQSLPPDMWDMAPFGGKTVRGILRHVADTEQWTVSRLVNTSTPKRIFDPLERLDAGVAQGQSRQIDECP